MQWRGGTRGGCSIWWQLRAGRFGGHFDCMSQGRYNVSLVSITLTHAPLMLVFAGEHFHIQIAPEALLMPGQRVQDDHGLLRDCSRN